MVLCTYNTNNIDNYRVYNVEFINPNIRIYMIEHAISKD